MFSLRDRSVHAGTSLCGPATHKTKIARVIDLDNNCLVSIQPRFAILIAFFFTQSCAPFVAKAQKPSSLETAGASSSIFKDVAAQVGINFQHYNSMNGKFYLPEIMGSGAALFDFDGDGDLDVFIVQGNVLEPGTKANATMFPWKGPDAPTGRLFRNDLTVAKDGSRTLKFTDVTEKSGIKADGYGMGVAVGDINNDGRPDLYLTNLGHNQMYLNKGDGTFVDVTQKTGTDDPRWSTSASFLDYDRDGWLDLMVLNYADFSVANSPACYAATTARDYCTPKVFRAPGNRLFHNKGDGTFEDVTAAAGIDKDFGHGLGVVTADFDGDGWPDIYVANDGDPNQLWINQKNGTFKNEALLAGAAVNRDGQAEAGMGVDAGDFDGNGTEDLFVTHLMDQTNTLYTNLGKGLFEDRTREAGLGLPGHRFTGFGTLFFDYDNDGWLDLLIANGAVQLLPDLMRKGDRFALGQPNQLFHNDGKGRFVETSDRAGDALQLLEASRGAAFGDIDNDGNTDVLLTNNNGPARLLLNQLGNRNHWLGLRLIGKEKGRDMLGAQVEIVISKNQSLWRRVRTDGSYLSANDPRVLAGLGSMTHVDGVRVRWPGGAVEEWKNPRIDQYNTLQEGTGTRGQ
jgi:enediyne biosynthesis protein E4